MEFSYQARDLSGRVHQGQIAAADADEAGRKLRQDGMYLLSLQEGGANRSGGQFTLFQKKISRNDVIYLTNQLAVMVDAGVPLAVALDGLANQSENPTLKSALTTIQQAVEGGEQFSSALARFPRQFDKTYVNLVKASEAGGTLGEMLERIAVQTRTELETRQKVRGAMIYPAVMLGMCVSVCVFLLTYVFPKLTPMFTARSLELPAPTRVLMAVSNALTEQWYWFVAGLFVLVLFAVWGRKQSWARSALDWTWLRLPILGPLLRKVVISRSLRTLATTINSGVPVLESIQLTAGVVKNVHYERSWNDIGEQVTAGRQIHEALEGNALFPTTLLQMIAAGESTGKLGHVLNRVSDHFDHEVDNAIKSATSLIEPIMVSIMGGVIGTIALAMLLPIFKLSTHVG